MTFGYHPLLAFLDNTNEALAGVLRPGRAGSNTAADHITVLDAARLQIPEAHRHGRTLVRCDGAGFSHAFLSHLAAQGLKYSLGWTISDPLREAITALPTTAWTAAVTAGNDVRDGADVAELTGMLPATHLAGWPAGLRLIVRREHPHPGAQLDAFVPEQFRHRRVAPRFALAYGRGAEFRVRTSPHSDPERLRRKRDDLAPAHVELATFDMLRPVAGLADAMTITGSLPRFKVVSIPPTFRLGPGAAPEILRRSDGPTQALSDQNDHTAAGHLPRGTLGALERT